MLAIERRKQILSRLKEKGQVTVSSLARQYEVSGETIRRDLAQLEQDGLVTRSYGGAVLNENAADENALQFGQMGTAPEKKAVGSILAGMIDDGDHIFIDPSATALAVVQELRQAGKKDITIITNAIGVLVECCECSGWDVISLGGSMQAGKFALVGPQTIEGIETYHADKAIVACKAIDMKKGVTDGNVMFAQVKRAMLVNAKERIVAVDSAKFDQIGFSRVCGLDEVDIVVTDTVPSKEWITCLAEKEVKCIYGEEGRCSGVC